MKQTISHRGHRSVSTVRFDDQDGHCFLVTEDFLPHVHPVFSTCHRFDHVASVATGRFDLPPICCLIKTVLILYAPNVNTHMQKNLTTHLNSHQTREA